MRASRLFLLAVLVRLFMTILALLADSLAPDYDNSMLAEVVSKTASSAGGQQQQSGGRREDGKVFHILDPLMRWDAVHFRHIAKQGYSHEHLCAFFPQMSNLFHVFGLVEKRNAPLVAQQKQDRSGGAADEAAVVAAKELFTTPKPPLVNELSLVAFHIGCFGLATVLLRSILLDLVGAQHGEEEGGRAGGGKSAAASSSSSSIVRAALLVWLINPASVFFTAMYTETYFALLAFAGIFFIHKLHKVVFVPVSAPSSSFSSSFQLPFLLSEPSSSSTSATIGTTMHQQPSQQPFDPTAAKTFRLSKTPTKQQQQHDMPMQQSSSSSSGAPPSSATLFAKALLWLFLATCFFFLASAFRSNGILLSGFPLHFGIVSIWFSSAVPRFSTLRRVILTCLAVISALVNLLPYHTHVHMCFQTFCGGGGGGGGDASSLSSTASASATSSSPFADAQLCSKGVIGFYSGIQFKYWKVGLFSYYTANNIPNFVIAAPTFVFCAIGFWKLVGRLITQQQHQQRVVVLSNNPKKNSISGGGVVTSSSSSIFVRAMEFLASADAAHLVYLFVQLLIAFTTMNVQVVTRFVSGTPAVYLLYGLTLLSQQQQNGDGVVVDGDVKKSQQQQPRRYSVLQMCCLGFVIVWALVGTAMFPNFMPWT